LNRIFFVAGERSGDAHGADLILALRKKAPHVRCEGLGGELMAAAGMELRHDLAAQAIMGFTEVLKHFWPMRRIFLDTVAYLREHPPDCVVLIDYPGFNIRLAKALHGLPFPIVYYISPQVWAWKHKRIYTLARYVRKMLVIFPFETTVYEPAGLETEYVGHPLLDRIPPPEERLAQSPPCVVGIFPGSREQEIARLLAPMLAVARRIRAEFPDAQFMAPAANAARAAQIAAMAGGLPLEIKTGGIYDILAQARFCMVASGTASLETALWGVPFIILYKVSPLTYVLARALVRTRFIGIVNILAGREVVPEFIQSKIQTEALLSTAVKLMHDTEERAQMLRDLATIRALLGEPGAADRAATAILALGSTPVHG